MIVASEKPGNKCLKVYITLGKRHKGQCGSTYWFNVNQMLEISCYAYFWMDTMEFRHSTVQGIGLLQLVGRKCIILDRYRSLLYWIYMYIEHKLDDKQACSTQTISILIIDDC